MPFRLLVLVLTAAAALQVSPALGAPTKPITMDVVPATEWAGVTDNGYTVELTNNTKTQELGSADITIPQAFTVVAGPSLGTVTPDNVLELRQLDVQPGDSVTVTLGLRMPCVAGDYPWRIQAKQSNDFSGPPGNALGPVDGNLNTKVEGSCKLRFVEQPANAERNEQIRADAFQPDSANRVTVEAIDGSPAPQRLTWFTGTVDLRLVQSGPGALSPSPASSSAIAGLAAFSNMAIDESGNYNLRATTTTAGFSGGDSVTFQVIGVVEPCRAGNCRAQIAGAGTTSTLLGDSVAGDGFALLSFELGPPPVCTGYTPASTDYYEFGLSGATADKTVVAAFGKAAVKKVGGPSKLKICFAAPEPFDAESGPAAPFDYDGDEANGAEGFVGLLPDCPDTPTEPCVLGRDPASGGVEVRFFVPADWGDPRYGG